MASTSHRIQRREYQHLIKEKKKKLTLIFFLQTLTIKLTNLFHSCPTAAHCWLKGLYGFFFSYNNNHIFRAQNAIATSSLRSNSSRFDSLDFYLACLLSNCLCHQPPKSSDLRLPFQVALFLIVFVLLISEHILSGNPSQSTTCFLTWMFAMQLSFNLKINITAIISLCRCKIYH